jgi:hypothetical protein
MLNIKQFWVQALFSFLILIPFFYFNVTFLSTQPISYGVFGFLGLGFLFFVFRDTYKNMFSFLTVPVIAVLSFSMVFLYYGPSLQAKWGVIDDHEVMVFLGNDGKMDLTEWWGYYSQTEAAKPGVSLRYRPMYQALRLLEIALWDNNPGLWYATRISIFTFFLAVIWFVAQKFIGFVPAGVSTFYIFSYKYWADIFSRLGPSEVYAVLGFGIFLICFENIVRTTSKASKSDWIGLCFGSILAMGSKENMILLLAPLAVLGGYLFFKKTFTKTAAISLVLSLAFGLFIVGASFVATQKTGTDIYRQSVATTDRVHLLVTSLKSNQVKQMIKISAFAVLLLIAGLLVKEKKVSKYSAVFLLVVTVLILIYTFQVVFYNGAWPTEGRYDFPGMLYFPVLLAAIIVYVRMLLKDFKVPEGIIVGLQWSIMFGICSSIIMKGFVPIQVAVGRNVEITNNHTNGIEKIAAVVNNNPTEPILFESANVWDFEPIYSLSIFLRTYGVKNPFYLQISGYDSLATTSGSLEADLAKQLVKISLEGNDSFTPINEFSERTDCYALVLSGIDTSTCKTLE